MSETKSKPNFDELIVTNPKGNGLLFQYFFKVDNTELNKACQSGDLDKVRNMLKGYIYVNNYDENGYTPLIVACRNGKCNIVRELLKYDNIDVDLAPKKYGYTPLITAISNICNETKKHNNNKKCN